MFRAKGSGDMQIMGRSFKQTPSNSGGLEKRLLFLVWKILGVQCPSNSCLRMFEVYHVGDDTPAPNQIEISKMKSYCLPQF